MNDQLSYSMDEALVLLEQAIKRAEQRLDFGRSYIGGIYWRVVRVANLMQPFLDVYEGKERAAKLIRVHTLTAGLKEGWLTEDDRAANLAKAIAEESAAANEPVATEKEPFRPSPQCDSPELCRVNKACARHCGLQHVCVTVPAHHEWIDPSDAQIIKLEYDCFAEMCKQDNPTGEKLTALFIRRLLKMAKELNHG